MAGMRRVSPNFITEVIDRDLKTGRHTEVITRFPPEPNGYLHIGHAKAIHVDHGVAADYDGTFHLRMDDTNPTTEDLAYVEAIKQDLEWLGAIPDELTFASDQFQQMYEHALSLIERGLAYVDSLSEEQIREYRGTVGVPGRPSPYRDRSIEANLDLFKRMRAGEFESGAHVLRARIDMGADNMLMRDPLLYRIRHAHHYRTGDDWPIYPLYDYAHPLTDALEGITHSLCSLEFENNREVYDWVVEHTTDGAVRPRQYEFSRLQLDYTILSKRKLIQLVNSGVVDGWDDPRMPTIAGLRRRGVTPGAIRDFADRVGITRTNVRTDYALLQHSIRDDLNRSAPRVMAVIDPLKVTITNFGEAAPLQLSAPYWPEDVPREGERTVTMSKNLLIERADFAAEPPKGFRRLSPGGHVRLRHGPVIRCDGFVTADDGTVTELRCSWLPETIKANPEGGIRVPGAIHWLDAGTALPAEFRLFDRLFTVPDPEATDQPFTDFLNPDSLQVRSGFLEPAVAGHDRGTRFQFERLGYFWQDPAAADTELVFNRIVTLKDAWARAQAREQAPVQEVSQPAAPKRSGSPASDEPAYDAATLEFAAAFGLDPFEAGLIGHEGELHDWFRAAAQAAPGHEAMVGRWLVNELQRELKETPLSEVRVTPAGFGELIAMIAGGVVSARAGKDVLAGMLEGGESPRVVTDRLGLGQVSDESELEGLVEQVLAENPGQVEAYRSGKTGLAGFFVGQVMRRSGGRANPQLVGELVNRTLGRL